MAKKFRQYTANMEIIIKNIPIEAHHFINMIERYHRPLQQVYSIITIEILDIKPELTLLMSFKAINNSVGLNRLVPTLLVFDIYLRMSELDITSILITQRAITIKKAINRV